MIAVLTQAVCISDPKAEDKLIELFGEMVIDPIAEPSPHPPLKFTV